MWRSAPTGAGQQTRLRELSQPLRGRRGARRAPTPPLSPPPRPPFCPCPDPCLLLSPKVFREVEVLDWIAKGNSNKEVARSLAISDQTVKNHVTSIMRKLAANDRTHAVVYALRQGWIRG